MGLTDIAKRKLQQIEQGGMKSLLTHQIKTVQLGVIGVGRHCRSNLLPCLPFLPMEVQSVCAAHLENAEMFGRKYGASAFYEDVHRMLNNESLDAVLCSVNADLHPDIIAACQEKNLPLFIEKPAAPSMDRIAALARSDKSRTQVGFQKRFAPNYQAIRDAIEKKTHGNLTVLQMEFGIGALSGNMENFLLEVGIHFIDLLRFFLPDVKIIAVRKSECRKGVFNITVQFENAHTNGTLLLSSNFDWENAHERVLAVFDEARIQVENLVDVHITRNSKTLLGIPLEKILKRDRHQRRWFPNYITGTMDNSSLFQSGFLPELRHFINAVAGGKAITISNLDNAAATHRLMEEMLDV